MEAFTQKIGSDARYSILEYESRQARLRNGDARGNLSPWRQRSLLLGLAMCTSCLNWGALLCVLTGGAGIPDSF